VGLDLWLAFVVASAIVLIVPGPTVILVVSYAVSQGRRSALATVPGVALGDAVAMAGSLLGLGALLAASATLFTVVKLAGAAYLIWLGIRLWRAPIPPVAAKAVAAPAKAWPERGRALFGHAFMVTALNPKSIAFFVAFVPQFLTPAAPLLPQMLVLGTSFVTLAAVNAALFALAAGSLRPWVRRPSVLRTINRIGGSLLIGAGLATAALRRGG
jgi:threonine/homoserine/homoserine lactone efflux protein